MADCMSHRDTRVPELAVDGDSASCYESGLESNSWWMTRRLPGLDRVAVVYVTGIAL